MRLGIACTHPQAPSKPTFFQTIHVVRVAQLTRVILQSIPYIKISWWLVLFWCPHSGRKVQLITRLKEINLQQLYTGTGADTTAATRLPHHGRSGKCIGVLWVCRVGGEEAGGAQRFPAALYDLSTNENLKVAGTLGADEPAVEAVVGSVECLPVPLPSASRVAIPPLEWPPDELELACGSS